MKCSYCLKDSNSLFPIIDVTNETYKQLCLHCFVQLSPHNDSLEEVDTLLNELENQKESIDRIKSYLSEHPQNYDDTPAIAFTPQKTIDMWESMYSMYIEKREKILLELSEYDRLTYYLQQSVKNENYENAAMYRDKINSLIKEQYKSIDEED